MSILEILEKNGGAALAAVHDAANSVVQFAGKEGGAVITEVENGLKSMPKPTPQEMGCSKNGKICI